MSHPLSGTSEFPDITSGAFRAAACDVGEVIALFACGMQPEAATQQRLLGSLRRIQTFLVSEADTQAGREAVSDDDLVAEAVRRLVLPVSVAMPGESGGRELPRCHHARP